MHDDLHMQILRLAQQLMRDAATEDWARVHQGYEALIQLIAPVPPPVATTLLAHPEIQALLPTLHTIRARYGFAKEYQWAQQVCAHADPWQELRRYPSYARYEAIVDFELGLCPPAAPAAPRRILLAGCGPLPLTALCLVQRQPVVVTGLDRNPAAIAMARALIRVLHAEHAIAYVCGDLGQLTDLAPYDVIMVAALVDAGAATKAPLVAHLSRLLRRGQVLLLRTAHHLYQLVYPAIREEDLQGLRYTVVPAPPAGVMHTTIYAEKDEAPPHPAPGA